MGFGLGPLLHKRHSHFFGILNGLDTTVWNPETDEELEVRYNATTLALRNRNKRALCEKCDLQYDQATPVVGMVTELEAKGFWCIASDYRQVDQLARTVDHSRKRRSRLQVAT